MQEIQEKEQQVLVVLDGQPQQVPVGSQLLALAAQVQDKYASPVIGALYNNAVVSLFTEVIQPGIIQFLDLTSEEGMRIYRQSLVFLLTRAVFELYPAKSVIVQHSLGKSFYCEFKGEEQVSSLELQALEAKMKELVESDEPIIPQSLSRENAVRILSAMGLEEKADLFNNLEWKKVRLYSSGSFTNYSYYVLAASTGGLGVFKLEAFEGGFLLRFPDTDNPRLVAPYRKLSKLFAVFQESQEWAKILGVHNVAGILELLGRDEYEGTNCIHVAEALHEKKIARIADEIYSKQGQSQLILVAGPSSSGKTTFAKRLAVQLRVLGLKPISVSTDDYFVDREQTPRDEHGQYDFEALEAIDLPLFNEHILNMMACREVSCPVFDFKTGRRLSGQPVQLVPGNPIIVEGIHSLNEKLTAAIPRPNKYKIYISALTHISIDGHNQVPTTDTRLIRRIVRDNQFRGRNALETLKSWSMVRRGEERNIFPFQEDADIMFNSALIYELCVFKQYVTPLLTEVKRRDKEFHDAQRLLALLSHFPEISPEHIPPNSILREFIGGSSFQ